MQHGTVYQRSHSPPHVDFVLNRTPVSFISGYCDEPLPFVRQIEKCHRVRDTIPCNWDLLTRQIAPEAVNSLSSRPIRPDHFI